MNTPKINKSKLLHTGKVASKAIEILCWAGVALMLMAAIAAMIDTSWATLNLMPDSGISMNGITMELNQGSDQITLSAIVAMLLGCGFCLALTALVFRNLHAVLKASQSGSPFQPENVKRIETIGWLSIAGPVAALVVTVLCKLLGGPDEMEFSLNLSGIFMGILVLILSQVFAHGVELEQDVDGLV